MKCADLNTWLDRLMDGDLTEDQRRELEAHGRECPDCAAQIQAALAMKALFDDMPAEVDVPLAAQAKWRGAVRSESKRVRTRRLYRWVGSAAAALLVAAGIGWALNMRDVPLRDAPLKAAPPADSAIVEAAPADLEEASPFDAGTQAAGKIEAEAPEAAFVRNEAPAMKAAEASVDFADEEVAVIEADGYAETSFAAAPQSAPMRECRLKVEDVDAACDRIADLVSEYDGTADVQRTDSGANLYVELPAENAADFLNAIAHLDVSGALADAIPTDFAKGTASLLLALEA